MSCSKLILRNPSTRSFLRFTTITKPRFRSAAYTTAVRTGPRSQRWKRFGASIAIAVVSTGFAATIAYYHDTVTAEEKDAEASTQEDLKVKQGTAEEILKYLGVSTDSSDLLIEKLCTYWNDKRTGIVPPEDCLINDAIHGSIELSPLLYKIVNTPEFHRLKDVRQLGAGHYVYPGANHTRFDHSIGVGHLAGVFAKSLKEKLEEDVQKIPKESMEKKQYRFDDEEVLCVQIAGLCHDLGHGPLSHMFEHKVVPKLGLKNVKEQHRHEDITVNIFRKMLKDNPAVLAEFIDNGLTRWHIKLIEEMINPPKKLEDIRIAPDRPFLYEIVANKTTGVDVDKWDYYARDCHYLGFGQDFQWRRCMLLARIVKTPVSSANYKGKGKLRVAFREKELDNIYGMFKTRAVLHQKAYQHKTVKAVEKMIADALLLVKDIHLIKMDRSGKSIKEAVELACQEDQEKVDMQWYLSLTDSIIGTILCADGSSTDDAKYIAEAQRILTRIKRRDLYHCVVKIPISKSVNRCTHSPNTTCKVCAKDDHRVQFAKELSKDGHQLQSFKKEICKDLSHIKPEHDIWVELVKIKLPSEEDEDPTKHVVFYEKPTSKSSLPKALSNKKQTSRLVVPQAFVEYELRVYDKREKDVRRHCPSDAAHLKEATKDALRKQLGKVTLNSS